MNIGERLKIIRQSKAISIYKLSQDSEVSESHIRNLERGKKHATVETLEMLVKSMDMSMSEFFNDDDSRTYLTPNEKALIEFFRTLPGDTVDAVVAFCDRLKNQQQHLIPLNWKYSESTEAFPKHVNGKGFCQLF